MTQRQALMFRITPLIEDDEIVLKLEGCLTGAWVQELDSCWREAANTLGTRPMRVDVRDVCRVDEAGRQLMTLMYRAGVRFMAKGCLMPEVVREIAGSADTGGRN
jgi:anti-anti-sigma regulatory factor